MGRSMQRLESIRGGKGVKNPAGRLYVPGSIAKHVPEGAQFECELTLEGILFRLVEDRSARPGWAKRQDQI